MVSTTYDIRTIKAPELKEAMNGLSTRNLCERMVIVTPRNTPENYVMVFGDELDAKLVGGRLGMSDEVKPMTGKELEPYFITEVPDQSPRTTRSINYVTEVNITLDCYKPRIWKKLRPAQRIKLSHYRIAIPGGETSIRASDFAEAFSIRVVLENEVNKVVNQLIFKLNGIDDNLLIKMCRRLPEGGGLGSRLQA